MSTGAAVSPQSRVELTVAHSPLAFFYDYVTPTVEINGTKETADWGVYILSLSPGDYEISVSYPWFFFSECGKNTARFHLEANETRKVKYCARLIRYLPGKITVN